jgi:hypothetical protein
MLLRQGAGRGSLRSRIADEAAVLLAGEEDGTASGQGTAGQRGVSPAARFSDGDDRGWAATGSGRRRGTEKGRGSEGNGGDRGWAATGTGWRRWGLDGGGGQTVTLAAIARNGLAREEMRSDTMWSARLYTEWQFSVNNWYVIG